MIEIVSIEFHTDLFHAGVNFGKKIGLGTAKNIAGIKMETNPEKTWVFFHYNDRTREIPVFGNVASWELASKKIPAPPKNEHKTDDVAGRRRAQVATPMDHVFRGEGHGKVR